MMSYQYIQNGHYPEIKMDRGNGVEIESVERLDYAILSRCFIDRDVCLFTIDPQPYSLLLELSGSYEQMINGKKILINRVSNCTSAILKLVSESEEFGRGLLIIASNVTSLDSIVKDLLSLYLKLPDFNDNEECVIVFCDNDGDNLYLYNSPISQADLDHLLT